MTTVAKHLLRTYKWVYVWFWGIAALGLAGIAISFEVFGHYSLDNDRVSVWETACAQGPRWFLFVMGIMWATVNLPVVVANGVTRRVYFRGAALFGMASAALFALLMLAGFGVERMVYIANGMMAEITSYPISTWRQAAVYFGSTFVSCLAFVASGWVVGLVFYRYQVWTALLLMPFAVLPIIAGVPVTGSTEPWLMGTPMAAIVLVGAAIAGYGIMRDVPVKTKKA